MVPPNRYGNDGVLRARFNDAVFVSLMRRYLFASNEKVANSTLRRTFQTLEGGGALPPRYRSQKRWTGPLLQPSDVPDFEGVLADPAFRKFVVVRNPYARLISCFRHKFEKGEGAPYRRKLRELGFADRDKISFSEFLHAIARQKQEKMNSHWRVQYYNVFMDVIPYTEIIKYEDLSARLPSLIAELYPEQANGHNGNGSGLPILTKNISGSDSEALIDKYFTPELKRLAQKIYAKDFETFGYPA